MLLLAFDTATPAITVALHDGTEILAESTTVDARRTGELLAPGITAVLAAGRAHTPGSSPASPSESAPARSPDCASAWSPRAPSGDALGIPVHGVCTLDVLAYQTGSAEPFAVATDARRKEVYWAQYTDYLTRSTEPGRGAPALIAERLTGLPVAGEGARLYPDAFPDSDRPAPPLCCGSGGTHCQASAERPGLPAVPGAALPAPPGRGRARHSQACLHRLTAWCPQRRRRCRPFRWWDIETVRRIEHDLFPEDPWSVGMFWSELADIPTPATTSSQRPTERSPVTRA